VSDIGIVLWGGVKTIDRLAKDGTYNCDQRRHGPEGGENLGIWIWPERFQQESEATNTALSQPGLVKQGLAPRAFGVLLACLIVDHQQSFAAPNDSPRWTRRRRRALWRGHRIRCGYGGDTSGAHAPPRLGYSCRFRTYILIRIYGLKFFVSRFPVRDRIERGSIRVRGRLWTPTGLPTVSRSSSVNQPSSQSSGSGMFA